ncbi:metal ABC transporter substrate-binding protein [Thauera phenolivorans]|uniref:metal ABC transporter substrate-binding protein n=1 Tax=Thauera phenolivorans TaxID=1792543 RepID=UPI00083A7E44|nr:metal ABC transporter substrate-binding protein [Thauera phenolivorans]
MQPLSPRITRRLVLVLSAALLSGVVLGSAPARAEPLRVSVSFSILGDFVRQVGGERVAVDTLVGVDEDAHAFQPRPSDARRLGAAQLVVTNGLGFDDWVARLARSAGYRGRVLVASEGIDTLAKQDDDDHGTDEEDAHRDREDGDDHDPGGIDPHAWQSVANAERYVANIAAALAELDPAGASHYRDNAARYRGELKALDAEIRAAFAAIPAERRKVVSSHDAFAYFARAYGVDFLAPVGVSNNAEPTAQGVARLIRQLRADKIPAVFIENVADPRLIERIRAESGARVGGTLYSDALSAAGGAAPDYLTMMRHNLRTIVEAIAPAP